MLASTLPADVGSADTPLLVENEIGSQPFVGRARRQQRVGRRLISSAVVVDETPLQGADERSIAALEYAITELFSDLESLSQFTQFFSATKTCMACWTRESSRHSPRAVRRTARLL